MLWAQTIKWLLNLYNTIIFSWKKLFSDIYRYVVLITLENGGESCTCKGVSPAGLQPGRRWCQSEVPWQQPVSRADPLPSGNQTRGGRNNFLYHPMWIFGKNLERTWTITSWFFCVRNLLNIGCFHSRGPAVYWGLKWQQMEIPQSVTSGFTSRRPTVSS